MGEWWKCPVCLDVDVRLDCVQQSYKVDNVNLEAQKFHQCGTRKNWLTEMLHCWKTQRDSVSIKHQDENRPQGSGSSHMTAQARWNTVSTNRFLFKFRNLLHADETSWVCLCYFHTANYAQTNQVHPHCFKQKLMITLRPWHLKQPNAKSAHNSLLTLFITSRNDPILWEWGPASAQGPGNNSPH